MAAAGPKYVALGAELPFPLRVIQLPVGSATTAAWAVLVLCLVVGLGAEWRSLGLKQRGPFAALSVSLSVLGCLASLVYSAFVLSFLFAELCL